ncbi:Myb-like domain [Sesbania bispinosa]|nr:Myb-like domain [Sesbania bispinosa]
MKKEENGDGNDSVRVSGRRTRSQAAPEWTVTESLILVNEIAAVEADCSKALSSYQQWDIIAGNCAALDVGRSLPQCRRKWQSLLEEYRKDKAVVTVSDGDEYCAAATNLDPELFEAIERVVKAREERSQLDPESDTEPPGNEALDATVQIGSRRKRQRSNTQRYRVKKSNKCQPFESSEDLSEKQDQSHKEVPEDHHSEEEYLIDFIHDISRLKCTAQKPPKHIEMSPKSLAKVELHEKHDVTSVGKTTISREENEEILTLKLQELALEIQAIGTESADYKSAGSQNAEDCHTEFTRCQGDKLIASLGNFSNTLKQLCDLVQECK